MSYQQLLDDAIGVAPPSTVDVDRVIGRRKRAAMAWTVAGSAAAVVLVTAGVTVAIAQTGSGSTAPLGGPSTVVAPTAAPSVPAPQRKPETSAEVAARLSHALEQNLREVLPDATLHADPLNADLGKGLFVSGEAVKKASDLSHHYLAQVIVTTPTGDYQVHMLAYLNDPARPTPSPSTSEAAWEPKDCDTFWPPSTVLKESKENLHCEERKGPSGARVLIGEQTSPGNSFSEVMVIFADGSRLEGEVIPIDNPSATPAITVEQLVLLMADADMAP
jgi:hypothetical protein